MILGRRRYAGGGYLLDTYSADVAYSLRKLSSTATYACKVQNRNTGDTCDVLLETSGSITLSSSIANLSGGSGSTLGAWLGSNIGVIFTWYDQSGNGNDATQSTFSQRPLIANASGVLYSDNGKTAINFDELTFQHLVFTESFPAASNFTSFNVVSPSDTTSHGFWGQILNNLISWVTAANVLNFRANDGANKTTGGAASSGQQLVTNLAISNTGIYLYKDASLLNSDLTLGNLTAMTSINVGIGTYRANGTNASENLNGYMQEFILYKSDQSSNRTAIESNINSYYTIY